MSSDAGAHDPSVRPCRNESCTAHHDIFAYSRVPHSATKSTRDVVIAPSTGCNATFTARMCWMSWHLPQRPPSAWLPPLHPSRYPSRRRPKVLCKPTRQLWLSLRRPPSGPRRFLRRRRRCSLSHHSFHNRYPPAKSTGSWSYD